MRKSNMETRLKNLPFIPARIRKFAYRYALEIKRTREGWAAEFGIKSSVVDRWLRHDGVKDYIAIVQGVAREATDYLEEIRGRLEGKIRVTG